MDISQQKNFPFQVKFTFFVSKNGNKSGQQPVQYKFDTRFICSISSRFLIWQQVILCIKSQQVEERRITEM